MKYTSFRLTTKGKDTHHCNAKTTHSQGQDIKFRPYGQGYGLASVTIINCWT